MNSADKEIRQNFARKRKEANVWTFIDEATTIREAAILVPLAKCYANFGKTTTALWMYGDPQQLVPIVLGAP